MSTNNLSNDDDFMSEINITPMVDVMLVLMLIFLVTAPILTNNIDINLPEINNDSNIITKPSEVAKIFINDIGDIFLNDTKQDTLEELFQNIITNNKDNMEIRIFADKNTPYHKIAKILGFLQQHEITNIGLVTEIK